MRAAVFPDALGVLQRLWWMGVCAHACVRALVFITLWDHCVGSPPTVWGPKPLWDPKTCMEVSYQSQWANLEVKAILLLYSRFSRIFQDQTTQVNTSEMNIFQISVGKAQIVTMLYLRVREEGNPLLSQEARSPLTTKERFGYTSKIENWNRKVKFPNQEEKEFKHCVLFAHRRLPSVRVQFHQA